MIKSSSLILFRRTLFSKIKEVDKSYEHVEAFLLEGYFQEGKHGHLLGKVFVSSLLHMLIADQDQIMNAAESTD